MLLNIKGSNLNPFLELKKHLITITLNNILLFLTNTCVEIYFNETYR